MTSTHFLHCIAQKPIADVILKYTFSLDTLHSLQVIAIRNEKEYPTLAYIYHKAYLKFDCVHDVATSYLQIQNLMDDICPYCGKWEGNNAWHYSQHITSLESRTPHRVFVYSSR